MNGPYGSFSSDWHPEAAGYVFLAGGIGIAPMMGMIRKRVERKDERPHILFAAHSSWNRVPLREELVAQEARSNFEVVHVLEEPNAGWEGEEDLAALVTFLESPRE